MVRRYGKGGKGKGHACDTPIKHYSRQEEAKGMRRKAKCVGVEGGRERTALGG